MNYNHLSDSTRTAYIKRTRQLSGRWRREIFGTNDRQPIDPMAFVIWLSNLRSTIKATSWRKYKSSIVYCLYEEGDVYWPLSDGKETLAAAAYLQAQNQSPCTKTSDKTSANKRKRFEQSELDQLAAHFLAHPSKMSGPILDFLSFNRFVGLRPVECANCRITWYSKINTLEFVVVNAKHDELRAHGEMRTISFEYPTSGLIVDSLAFFQYLDIQKLGRGDFNRRQRWEVIFKKMEDALGYACRSIWPRRKSHIALYTSRHVAAAFLKQHLQPVEVAALLGHATDETAFKHYARPSKSRGSIAPAVENLPIANLDEILRVRQKPRRGPPVRPEAKSKLRK